MHVVASNQGSERRRPSFDAVAQINRRLGVHRVCVDALLVVTRDDFGACHRHRRVLAEIIDKIDKSTAIATLRLDQLAELTISPSRPQGYSEWTIARTLRDLRAWGYVSIDWPTGRYTIAQSLDSHSKGGR